MKDLKEKRNDLLVEMDEMLNKVETEKRAFNGEEEKRYNEIEKEIKDLDNTIEKAEKRQALENRNQPKGTKEERAEAEERAFANYVRGIVENRSDVNLTVTDNGAVIPSTIANKIILKVYEISPIYQMANHYNIAGSLTIPYYDETTQAITMSYATEFSALTSNTGKTTNITLTGFLAGALTKISRSLINNSKFDITSFIINRMSLNIARWIEGELLKGTASRIDGLSGTTLVTTTASPTAITADELITLQDQILDAFQGGAIWLMNRATRTALRKLKDGDGKYMLNPDMTAKWGYSLLGKPVYCSDNMDTIASGKTTIYYGDMSGLAVKVSEEINMQILREKYADEHAIGVVGWVEIDSKIENAQMIAKLVQHV